MRLSLHVGLTSCYYKLHHVKANSWRMMIYFDITLLQSFQSALTHLLTTSGPHGTFRYLSTAHGCISIIEFLQFAIVRLIIVLGKRIFFFGVGVGGGGGTADGSKLIKLTLNSVWPSGALLKRSQPLEKNTLHFSNENIFIFLIMKHILTESFVTFSKLLSSNSFINYCH